MVGGQLAKLQRIELGLDLALEQAGIFGTESEERQAAGVAEHGKAERFGKLAEVLVGEDEPQAELARRAVEQSRLRFAARRDDVEQFIRTALKG